ncbi:hypothetical protein LTR04_003880, partial [Oleoguttula sp. CCFEE 6159]
TQSTRSRSTPTERSRSTSPSKSSDANYRTRNLFYAKIFVEDFQPSAENQAYIDRVVARTVNEDKARSVAQAWHAETLQTIENQGTVGEVHWVNVLLGHVKSMMPKGLFHGHDR